MPPESNGLSSSGHKLGQIVGDWWEIHVIYPLLKEVADDLGLFLDNRNVSRTCRGEKIQWEDSDNNIVDYDFVLELDGSDTAKGIPVAFFESFWRRGARHSKDKARDDTNKLLPMRETYPTARYLAIAACGEFTEPARDYVRNRLVDLFFIPKSQIIKAFSLNGITIDYSDSLPEEQKFALVLDAEAKLNAVVRSEIGKSLREVAGESTFEGFKSKVDGALSALPQEIRFIRCGESSPICFSTTSEAEDFLKAPDFPNDFNAESFRYEVTYSDGFEFSRSVADLEELRALHSSLRRLVDHLENLRR